MLGLFGLVGFVALIGSGSETGPWIRVPAVSDRGAVPVVSGLPLPRGRSIDELEVSIHERSGRRVPATIVPAFESAARGAEGRRWIRAEFVGSPGAAYRVRWAATKARAPETDSANRVQVEQDDGNIRLRDGIVEVTFDARGGPFPVEIRRGGDVLFGPGSIDLVWPGTRLERRARDGSVASLSVEAVSASRVTVLAVGSFGDRSPPPVGGPGLDVGSIVDYRIRTTWFPSTGEMQFDMRLHLRGEPPALSDPSSGESDERPASFAAFVLRPTRAASGVGRVAGRTGTIALEEVGADGSVELRSDDASRVVLEQRGRAVASLSTNVGSLSVEGERHRVCVSVPSFLVRYPKRLRASRVGIRVELARVSSWKPHASRRFTVVLRLEEPRGAIACESVARRPIVAPADPRWYRDQALLRPWRELRGKERGLYERLLDRVIAEHMAEQQTTRAYGEWDFGDWRFFEGWGNLEFDTAFGCVLEFYRSGRGDALRHAIEGIEHWVDVDRAVDPAAPEFGLPLRHGRDHGRRVDLGHVWVEGLLHAVYLTGDPFLREAFEETSAALVRVHDDRPQTVTRRERDAAWQLLAMVTAHEALGDTATGRALRSLEQRVLARVDPATGWIRLDDARSGAALGSGWKVTPWVASGIVLPALVRSWRSTQNPASRVAVQRLATALREEAIETGVPGMRASLTIADACIVERSGFVRGDWALFAARGFIDAGIALDDERLARCGRRLVHDALEGLDRHPDALDGRARSRILLNGPFLGLDR